MEGDALDTLTVDGSTICPHCDSGYWLWTFEEDFEYLPEIRADQRLEECGCSVWRVVRTTEHILTAFRVGYKEGRVTAQETEGAAEASLDDPTLSSPLDVMLAPIERYLDRASRAVPTGTQHEQALRYNEGKASWSLMPWGALREVLKVFEYGATKYAPNNWRKGLPYSELLESTQRHLIALHNGEDMDEESKEDHAAHVAANMLFLLQYRKTCPEFDDRYRG